MPIATPEVYAEMLNRARDGKFAYPAINVTSSQTITAALQGFAEAESDGILQVSVGGAEYGSGSTIKNRVTGSLALAAYATEVAKNYGITVALHTDHCAKQNIDSWVRPLLEIEAGQVAEGKLPTFQSHMWDGSAIDLDENLEIAKELLALSVKANTILEIEVGAVGGEEDGVVGEINEKLYTTTADAIKTVEALGLGENGRYLGTIQKEVAEHYGLDHRPFDLVMHGGSGSTAEEIATAVANGVIKMNVDTDTQYAFTRPVVDHMLRNYDGVLKIDGEVGIKKQYDPRTWGKSAEAGMAARVVEACERLGATGTQMR